MQRDVTSLQENQWLRKLPDTMIGSIEPRVDNAWVMGTADEVAASVAAAAAHVAAMPPSRQLTRLLGQQVHCGASRAAYVTLKYYGAAWKVVDEVLQNAADQAYMDAAMRHMDVAIDPGTGRITVTNDGMGMPVTRTKDDTSWTPTQAFSKLMTSSNFETVGDALHLQGGRNGVGAKATNATSTVFTVTVGDPVHGLKFTQTWTDGMQRCTEPAIVKYSRKTGFVTVSFILDVAYFSMVFDDAFAGVVRARVYELAALTPPAVTVRVNGVALPIKGGGLGELARNVLGVDRALVARDSVVNPDGTALDVVVCPAGGTVPSGVLGWVNGVRCCGGTHTRTVLDAVVDAVSGAVAKRAGVTDLDVVGRAVKASTFVMVALRMHKPAFTSQSKEVLATTKPKCGPLAVWTPDPGFVRALGRVVADAVTDAATSAADGSALKKATASTRATAHPSFPDYDPASVLLTRSSAAPSSTPVRLMLAEGVSARSTAMVGRAVLGHTHCGVFALRGKPLNPRGMKDRDVWENVVLNNLRAIVGLTYGKRYDPDTSRLNYDEVWLVADQDTDGDHIVGLIVNYFHWGWPELLQLRPGFLRRLGTPLVVARAPRVPDVPFLTSTAFDAWLAATGPAAAAKYTFSYYKGLGGHETADARRYFAAADKYSVALTVTGADDVEALLDLYDPKRAKTRKELLSAPPFPAVDYDRAAVSVKEYMRGAVLEYSRDHLRRNLPGADGLTVTKRKLVWAFRKDGTAKEGKMLVLAAKAQGESHYHHGDASLYGTATGLGQTHVGSNNVNLFKCIGQFGNRNLNRQQSAAAPRYISTGVEPITNLLLRPEDDPLLTYVVEDGDARVEPVAFAPVLPLDLVNGCEGVATGWSTSIPPLHVDDLVAVTRAVLAGKPDVADPLPWFDGFLGVVELADAHWAVHGLYEVDLPGATVTIYELPVGTWTTPYKADVLDKLPWVNRVVSECTDTRAKFVLSCDADALVAAAGTERVQGWAVPDDHLERCTADAAAVADATAFYARRPERYPALERVLGMTSVINRTNMHRLNDAGTVVKFDTLVDIVRANVDRRLPLLAARLAAQIQAKDAEVVDTRNKARFVAAWMACPMFYPDVDAWWDALRADGYTVGPDGTYRYLTDMRMASLTHATHARLLAAADAAEALAAALRATTPLAVWLAELEELTAGYKAFAAVRRTKNQVDMEGVPAAAGAGAAAVARPRKKPKTAKK
jgi:DNA topoisomerase II